MLWKQKSIDSFLNAKVAEENTGTSGLECHTDDRVWKSIEGDVLQLNLDQRVSIRKRLARDDSMVSLQGSSTTDTDQASSNSVSYSTPAEEVDQTRVSVASEDDDTIDLPRDSENQAGESSHRVSSVQCPRLLNDYRLERLRDQQRYSSRMFQQQDSWTNAFSFWLLVDLLVTVVQTWSRTVASFLSIPKQRLPIPSIVLYPLCAALALAIPPVLLISIPLLWVLARTVSQGTVTAYRSIPSLDTVWQTLRWALRLARRLWHDFVVKARYRGRRTLVPMAMGIQLIRPYIFGQPVATKRKRRHR